ncbi:MAG: hypothetical protein K6F66_06310 [Pseudobutyrivibrio sp.]|nr:hypothetical protein [Pseudobutyrivibrio sp.]
MKTKPIPIIITLAAALISCVTSIVQRVEFSVFLSRLAIVVAIFLVMGTIIKIILDYSFKTLEPPVPLDEQLDSVVPLEDEDQPDEEINTSNDNPLESEEG